MHELESLGAGERGQVIGVGYRLAELLGECQASGDECLREGGEWLVEWDERLVEFGYGPGGHVGPVLRRTWLITPQEWVGQPRRGLRAAPAR